MTETRLQMNQISTVPEDCSKISAQIQFVFTAINRENIFVIFSKITKYLTPHSTPYPMVSVPYTHQTPNELEQPTQPQPQHLIARCRSKAADGLNGDGFLN